MKFENYENYQKPQRLTQKNAELYFTSLEAQAYGVQDSSNIDPLEFVCQDEAQKELLEEVSSQIQKNHREKYKRILSQIMEGLPITEIGTYTRDTSSGRVYKCLARLRKVLDAKILYEKYCYRQSVSYTPYTLTSQKLKSYKVLKEERQSLRILKNPSRIIPDIRLLLSCSSYPSSYEFNCSATPSSSFRFESLPIFPSFYKNFYIENNFKFKKRYKKVKIEKVKKAEQKEVKPAVIKDTVKASLETTGERLKREESYCYG